MTIRNKILIYFSTTVTALMAISFIIIYILFSEYREEQFQQEQKAKVQYTIKFLTEYTEMNENLANVMDKLTIHDFYDEKMLVFNGDKKIIFSSLDDLPIAQYNNILNALSPSKEWIETKEDEYDLVGLYYEFNGQNFYAISKAYDALGYDKMFFLESVLIGMFIFITLVVILISHRISAKISKPITLLAEHLDKYDLNRENVQELSIKTTSYELDRLKDRFNELLRRTNEAFTFQKHTIHHISHQLKTPIAVLVSELEKINKYENIEDIKPEIANQAIKAKSLGSIINVLLEIAKIESGHQIQKRPLRIDELFFDVIQELNTLYPDFHFEVNYLPEEVNEERLIVNLNSDLTKQAIQNLLANCVSYSNDSKAEIIMDSSSPTELKILIINSGKPISLEEEKFLFNHFFRGDNSQGKIGFGLGLVLTKKILELNSAKIAYSTPSDHLNIFEVRFPLS